MKTKKTKHGCAFFPRTQLFLSRYITIKMLILAVSHLTFKTSAVSNQILKPRYKYIYMIHWLLETNAHHGRHYSTKNTWTIRPVLLCPSSQWKNPNYEPMLQFWFLLCKQGISRIACNSGQQPVVLLLTQLSTSTFFYSIASLSLCVFVCTMWIALIWMCILFKWPNFTIVELLGSTQRRNQTHVSALS